MFPDQGSMREKVPQHARAVERSCDRHQCLAPLRESVASPCKKQENKATDPRALCHAPTAVDEVNEDFNVIGATCMLHAREAAVAFLEDTVLQAALNQRRIHVQTSGNPG